MLNVYFKETEQSSNPLIAVLKLHTSSTSNKTCPSKSKFTPRRADPSIVPSKNPAEIQFINQPHDQAATQMMSVLMQLECYN